MTTSTPVVAVIGSKMAQARVIYNEIHTPGYNLAGKTQRAAFIARAQVEIVDKKTGLVACSKHCAGTYYQNISDHVNKGTGLYHRNKPAKKATKKSVAQAEAEVLLSLPHLAKERWMVVNDAGVEVNNFKSRSEAQAAAKVNGFKWADRSKAA